MSREERLKNKAEAHADPECQDKKSLPFGILRDIAGHAVNDCIDLIAGRKVEKEYLASVSGELADKYVRGRELVAKLGTSNLGALSADERACVRAYLKIRALPSSLPFYDRETLTKDIDRELTAKAGRQEKAAPAKTIKNENGSGPPNLQEAKGRPENLKSGNSSEHRSDINRQSAEKKATTKTVASKLNEPIKLDSHGVEPENSRQAVGRLKSEREQKIAPQNELLHPQVKNGVETKDKISLVGENRGRHEDVHGKPKTDSVPVPSSDDSSKGGAAKHPNNLSSDFSGPRAGIKHESEVPIGKVAGAEDDKNVDHEIKTAAQAIKKGTTVTPSAASSAVNNSRPAGLPVSSAAPSSAPISSSQSAGAVSTNSFAAGEDRNKPGGSERREVSSERIKPIDEMSRERHPSKRLVIDTLRRLSSFRPQPPVNIMTLKVTARVGVVAASASRIGVIIHDGRLPVARAFNKPQSGSIKLGSTFSDSNQIDHSPVTKSGPERLQKNNISQGSADKVKTRSQPVGPGPAKLSDSEKRYLINGPELAFAAIIALAGAARARTEEGAMVRQERLIAVVQPKDDEEPQDPAKSSNNTEEVEEKSPLNRIGTVPDRNLNSPPAKSGRGHNQRPRVIIGEGDSLVGLAEELFDDPQLAWLILEINDNLAVLVMDGKHIVRLRTRQILYIPTAGDIKSFVSPRESAANIVTVVEDSEVDRELLARALEPFLGAGVSEGGELLSQFGDLIIEDE